MKSKVLLLSAYHAASHKRWCKQLVDHLEEFEWTQLSLAPRYFNWRIRGNPLSWLDSPEFDRKYDLIIATSMVDLATLCGIHPRLAQIPKIVYFHENQFDYPVNSAGVDRPEPKLVNLYSAIAADIVVFNSGYNRETFARGVKQMMQRMPDKKPKNLDQRLQHKSRVLAVPLEDSLFQPSERNKTESNKLRILWNHRWEYDKGPDRLLMLFDKLSAQTQEFEFVICGESFRSIPQEFSRIRENYSQYLHHIGYVEDVKQYHQLMRSCDVVLSTSMHDFQGLSVLEAVAMGVMPLVPNRLAYTNFLPEDYCYDSCPDEPEKEADALVQRMLGLIIKKQQEIASELPDIHHLSWSQMKYKYLEMIHQGMEISV